MAAVGEVTEIVSSEASMDRPTKYEYPLKDKITYTLDGHVETAEFFELRAPTSRNRRECALLKQSFFVALKEQQTSVTDEEREKAKERLSETEDEDLTLDGDEILAIMSMAGGIELDKVIDLSVKLFTNGAAFVDARVKVNQQHIDRLSYDDLESMTGEYLKTFLLRSALDNLRQT